MMCPAKNPSDEEILIEYCSGTLDRDRAIQFEAHLSACPDCSRIVADQKAVFASLDTWEPAEISADFDKRLYARISDLNAEPIWQRWLNALWKPALVTAAAAGVLIFATMVRVPSASIPTKDAPKQMRAEGVDAEQMEHTLEDLDLLTPAAEASQM